jgi:gluconate 5-dehydrogenase
MDDPNTLFDLSGKVACAIAASSGLGRRTALASASAGVSVVRLALRPDALDNVASAKVLVHPRVYNVPLNILHVPQGAVNERQTRHEHRQEDHRRSCCE